MVKSNITLKSYDYLMNSDFERIKIGKRHDMNFNLYQREYIDSLLDYFKGKQEFDKCQIIKEYIDKIYNHERSYGIN